MIRRKSEFHLVIRQGGSRLVESDDAGTARQRPQNLDDLALGWRQCAAKLFGADDTGEAVPGEILRHLRIEAGAIEQATATRQGAGIDVFGDGNIRDDLGFLHHHANAELARRMGRCENDGLAIDGDAAFVGLMHTAHQPQQRRFAGTVLAHQCEHLAAPRRERDAAQRLHGAKTLGDVFHFEDDRISHGTPFSRGPLTHPRPLPSREG